MHFRQCISVKCKLYCGLSLRKKSAPLAFLFKIMKMKYIIKQFQSPYYSKWESCNFFPFDAFASFAIRKQNNITESNDKLVAQINTWHNFQMIFFVIVVNIIEESLDFLTDIAVFSITLKVGLLCFCC